MAVEVIDWPSGTAFENVTTKLAFPLVPVVKSVDPKKRSPSPLPDTSQVVLEKNSRRKVLLAVLLRFPSILMDPPVAEVNTG